MLSQRRGLSFCRLRRGKRRGTSNLDRVEVLRPTNDGRRENVSLGPISGVGRLESGDLVIVHPDRQTKFERFLTTTSLVTGILTAALLATLAVQNARK